MPDGRTGDDLGHASIESWMRARDLITDSGKKVATVSDYGKLSEAHTAQARKLIRALDITNARQAEALVELANHARSLF
jgi:hypothetical protein